MRLRNRNIPQAGTGAKSNGESRPGPSGSGCPSYSGGDDVPHKDDNPSNNILLHRDSSSSRLSPISSLFSSLPSSPASYLNANISRSTSSSSLSIESAVDVVQEAIPAIITAPAHSKECKRKKWSKSMNIFIMHQYFILTKLETDTKSYLTQLHILFTSRFPEMDASKQRVGDQRRAIVQRQLLSRQEILDIKNDVKKTLHNQSEHLTNGQDQTELSNNDTDCTLRRMRWTTNINEKIMRAYYRITKLESDLTTYRPLLHQQITATCPSIAHLSIQRIADQRRSIVSNHLLSRAQLKKIREEVQKELDILTPETTDYTEQQTDKTPRQSDVNGVQSSLDDITSLPPEQNHLINSTPIQNREPAKLSIELETQLKEMFIEANNTFQNISPTARLTLPKLKPSKKLYQIIDSLNSKIIPSMIDDDTDFNTLHTYIYTAAYTATKFSGVRINVNNTTNSNETQPTPWWQKRLENRINGLRASIGRLTEYTRGVRSTYLDNHIQKIKQQYKVHSQHETQNSDISHFLDTLKQKLNILSNRLKRYKDCTVRKKQNKEFNNNEKLFYRKLAQKQTTQRNNNTHSYPTPSSESMHTYWSNIWSHPKQHENSHWIEEDRIRFTELPEMEFEQLQIQQMKAAIAKTHNWKAPGSDKIHNFWYKKLTCTHILLHRHINLFIHSPDTAPLFITQGITYMLPKDNSDTANPAKYRPITCLQNIYKIITACISELIYTHIEKHNILAEEQKGCRKYSQGCKEQLIIDSVISQQALKQKRNIYTMYIDYKKAFDSVPHSWLIYILRHYKINPIIINYLEKIMPNWHTKLKMYNSSQSIETAFISIKRGIFQGDSLSPLWFCLALNPLSYTLNDNERGFKIKYNSRYTSLSHLMYMDDIKLFANTLNNIHILADLTQTFSNTIHMDFGIDKCKIQVVKKGTLEHTQYTLNNDDIIDSVDPLEGYKYLGYYQSKKIHYKEIKNILKQKFKERLHKILLTHLNAKNTTKAINTYAIPILTYSFGVIRWSQTELKTLQRLINTTMTKHRKHHPRGCIQRLILPKHEGGRGLIDIVNLHNRQITHLRAFFYKRAQEKTLHQAICHADTHTPLSLADNTKKVHVYTNQQKIETWTQKSLHGRHRLDLTNNAVDKIASNAWLKQGELFPETEGFMLAIQDQVIDTKNYRKYIIKDRNFLSDNCRHCHKHPETIQHITGACSSITQTDYKYRHDQVAAIIHQILAHKYNLITEKSAYYKYVPEIILESSDYKLYWDRTILTDKTVHHNRPDITLHDKRNRTVYLIDIAIPNTHNLIITHTTKVKKYTDLTIEIKSQWKVNTVKTIPVIISTTGIIPKTLHTSLKTLNIHPLTYITLQKSVILNTCRIVRKFLTLSD